MSHANDSTAAFARDLSGARLHAGKSIRQVSRASGIATATLGGYFSGRHLPPANRPEVLTTVLAACDVPREDHDAWRERLLALHDQRRRGVATRAPYPGLRAFQAQDQDLFFGREELLARLQQKIRGVVQAPQPVLMVVGPSGSGKSSFLRAAVQVALGASRCAVCRPAEVEDVLTSWEPQDRDEVGLSFALVVDQFEEVWTDPSLRDRAEALIDRLTSWAAEGPGRVLVLGLRADFYGEAMLHPDLATSLQHHQILVEPLDSEGMRSIIEEPAKRVGLALEPGLVDVILADVRSDPVGSVLPHLAHVLDAMWRSSDRHTLRTESYRQAGGFEGAIRQSAEETLVELPAEQQDVAMKILLRMVTSAPPRSWTHRLVPLAEIESISPEAPTVLDHLIERRLVTVGTDTATLSHEALLGAWPRLHELVEARRGDLARREALERSAREWEAGDRGEDHLLRGRRLAAAEEWVNAATEPLAPLQRDYLTASQEFSHRLEADRVRSRRRRLVALAAVTVLALLTTLTTVLAANSRNQAQENLALAQSRQLSGAALNLRSINPPLSRQLGLAAYQTAPTREARSALLDATTSPVVTGWQHPDAQLERAAVLAGGEYVALAGPAGGLVVVRAQEGPVPWQVVGRLPDLVGSSEEVAVSRLAAHPHDSLVVAAGLSGEDPGEPRLVVVDLADPQDPVASELSVSDRPTALTFAADGELLLVVDGKGRMHSYSRDATGEWDVTGEPLVVGELVDVLAANEDGSVVAAAMESGTVRVWEASGGEVREIGELATGRQLFSVAVTDDGAALAAVGRSGFVHWIEIQGGELEETRTLYASDTNIFDVVIDSEDGLLATAGWDGVVSIWGLADEGPPQGSASLRLPTPRPLLDIAEAGGRWLFTGLEGPIFAWDADGPALPPLSGNVFIVGASTEGDRYITSAGPAGGVLTVWDASAPHAPRLLHTLQPDDEDFSTGAGAISADGRRVAMGTSGGRVLVWQVDGADPEVVLDEELDVGILNHVLLSDDATTVIAFSRDGDIRVLGLDGTDRGRVLAELEMDGGTLGGGIRGDGLLAVSDSSPEVQLVDLSRPDVDLSSIPLGVAAYGVDFSRDDDLLALSLADNSVVLYDVSDPTSPVPVGEPLTGPSTVPNSVKFAPGGDRLAVAAAGGQAWIYTRDADQWLATAVLRAGLANLQDVAWSADGSVLLGGGLSGSTRLWLTDPAQAADQVCRSRGVTVTEQDWADQLPGVAYQPPCETPGD